eukprot:4041531-Prymnesium_polylepis.1
MARTRGWVGDDGSSRASACAVASGAHRGEMMRERSASSVRSPSPRRTASSARSSATRSTVGRGRGGGTYRVRPAAQNATGSGQSARCAFWPPHSAPTMRSCGIPPRVHGTWTRWWICSFVGPGHADGHAR